jgi:hypothetical protein
VIEHRGEAEKQFALLVVSPSSFFTSFVIAAVNVAFPSMGRDLSMDAVDRANAQHGHRDAGAYSSSWEGGDHA